jgi:hypothetical protein
VEPIPVGGLAEAVSRELSRPTFVGLAIGVVLALGSIPAALWLMLQAGQVPQIPVLALAGLAGFLAALVCAVALPPFLLPPRSRRALAAFMWIGAVEIRRQLGGTSRALGFPSSPEAVPAWIRANPETPQNRAVHVEVRVFAGDFGGAREVLGRLPVETPVERFRRAAVRPSIPDSDFVILLRDHGWPPLRYLLVRVWLPVAALIVAIMLLVTLGARG